jgi:ATP-dependent DNA helicase RecG
LRGRVGRGAEASWCILLGDVSPDVHERLQVFVESDDGFEIAREDLRRRGMGDLFGERQHGEAMFKVADPMRDEELNARAMAAAAEMLGADPELRAPEHAELRRRLGERYSRAIELFRVG